jgi:hypothetical protein
MRRSFKLIIGGAVIVLLVGGYILVKHNPWEKAPSPLPAYEKITSADKDSLREITITNPRGGFRITKTGDAWAVEGAGSLKIDASELSRYESLFTYLTADRVIGENPEGGLAPFGLDSPRAKAAAKLADGTIITLLVGNKTATGSGYYLMKEGDPKVYTVGSYDADRIFLAVQDLRDKNLGSINVQELTYVKIRGKETIEFRERSGTEDLGALSSKYVVTLPYKNRTTDSQKFEEFLKQIPASFSVSSFVEDNPKDLALYGLAPAAREFILKDKQGSIHILLGKTTENGDVYAKLADAPGVFTLSSYDVGFLDADSYSLIDKFILIVNIETVDSLVIEASGAKTVAEIKRDAPKEGEEKGEEHYFVDGVAVEEGAFKAFYQAAIGILSDSPNKDGIPKVKPEVTITYRMNKGSSPELAARFYPVDRTYYAAQRDGSPDFLVGRYQIAKLLEAIETVKKANL